MRWGGEEQEEKMRTEGGWVMMEGESERAVLTGWGRGERERTVFSCFTVKMLVEITTTKK